MARKPSVARDNTYHSNLGGLAPINTPTRHIYGSQDEIEVRETGVSNPNIYVVQPFKNASRPKDLIYAKKNAPNPGESLLNSTMELIQNFTLCYETVKHELQDQETKEKEFINKSMIIGTRNKTNTKSNQHRPIKQAKLRPLMIQQYQNHSTSFYGNSLEIPPKSETNDDEHLMEIYEEKLRLLRRFKPHFFDAQGNLRSRRKIQSHLHNQSSASFNKKSSIQTSHENHFTIENDHRTFLTEFTKNEEKQN